MASRNRTANIQSRASQKAGQWRDDMGDNIYGDYTVEASTGTVTSGIGYVPGVGFDDPSLGNVAAYIGTDLIGTERRVVDSSTGGSPVIHRSILTAFGEPVSSTGGAGVSPATRYAYAGDWGYETPDQSFDPLTELGWQHVGERYYDPAVGRFMQRDPIGIRGGINTYAYSENAPTVLVDPDGLSIIGAVIGVGLKQGLRIRYGVVGTCIGAGFTAASAAIYLWSASSQIKMARNAIVPPPTLNGGADEICSNPRAIYHTDSAGKVGALLAERRLLGGY